METNNNARILAEEQLARLNHNLDALTPELAKEIIIDLQVKNIELEKQNNELVTKQNNFNNIEGCDDIFKSEEKFRKLFAESLIPIAIFNKPFNFGKVNKAFVNMMGYSEEELKHMTFKDITHSETIDIDFENVTKLIKGEITSYKTEKKYITKSKEIKWGYANLTALRNDKGNFLCFVVMINDITARKLAEDSVKHSKEQYQRIFFESSIGMITSDINFNFSMANQAFVNFIGYTESELQQMSFEDITHPENLKQDITNVNKLLRGEIPFYTTEKKYITKNNEIKWGFIYVNILQNKDGKFFSFLVMIIDITARKKAEIIIEEQNLKLKELNATKDKFFSIIAHDLRNSFNSIYGFSELIQIKAKDYTVDEIKRDVKIISESAGQTYKLLENLLEWSSVQSGKLRTNIKMYNIHTIVRDVCTLYEEKFTSKNIKVINNIPSEATISCDIDIMMTIFRNLINNAIKYSNPKDTITISFFKSDYQSIIQVKDTGIGISNKRLPDIFSIDKNESTRGTLNEKGSGLGLILCKELIELQGGRIRIESEEGKGTTVTLLLKDIIL